MKISESVLVGLLLLAVALPPAAEAGGLAKAALRGAAKSSMRSVRGTAVKTLRKDLLRDRATPARLLSQDRAVFRYTTKAQAARELRRGIQPGSHLTARATAGRPLSGMRAQRRYGLPRQPKVRETVLLRRDQPVRLNRTVGGAPGVGEVTSTRRIPSGAIKKVVPLQTGR